MQGMNEESLHNTKNIIIQSTEAGVEKKWQRFEADQMTDEERISFLERLLAEEDEISRMADLELAPIPAYLEEEILDSVLEGTVSEVKNEAQAMANPIVYASHYRPPKWVALLSYSAKVAFAAACAIIALFKMPDMAALNEQRVQKSWEQELLERETEAKEWQEERAERDAKQAERLKQELLARESGKKETQSLLDVIDTIQSFTKNLVGGLENETEKK